jgi:hypothetical protein
MILKGTLKYSGILKLEIDNDFIEYETNLVKNQKMHVTLVHQSIFKLLEYNGKKLNKYLSDNPPPSMEFHIDLNITPQTFYEDNKEALVFFVEPESQEYLDKLVQAFFERYKLKEKFNEVRPTTLDAGRKFHISYANKSGNPGDSIAVVW